MAKATRKQKKKLAADLIPDKKVSDLTIGRELFCRYYLFGGEYTFGTKQPKYKSKVKGKGKKKNGIYFRMGNATFAYAQAFEINIDDPKQYISVRASASETLALPSIKLYMRKLIEENGFNDEVVDSRLNEIITSGRAQDANTAIKEYNILRKRIDNQSQNNIIIVNDEKKGSLNKALEYLKKK